MKRDMDLVRDILFEVEKLHFDGGACEVSIPNRSPEEIAYHVKLLAQANLLEVIDMSSMDGPYFQVRALTWSGHEFLDASRDSGRWAKAKDAMARAGGAITFDVLKAALIKIMTSQIC